MNQLSTALTVLSAMITPAVLISGCGSLIIATSSRLGRVIDRTRKIAGEFEKVALAQKDNASEDKLLEDERALLFELLTRAARRTRLLQRSLASLYAALSVFVATSVAIGVVSVANLQYNWLPLLLGISGSGLLFYASLLLIFESRIALSSVDEEMDFVLRASQMYASEELRQRLQRKERWYKF